MSRWRQTLAILFGVCICCAQASAAEVLPDAPQAAQALSQDRHLVVAWSDQPPYQFQADRRGIGYPSGVDLAVMKEAARRAGLTVSFRYRPFDVSLSLLAEGRLDVVPGAYVSRERRRFAEVSPAYREGRDRLLLAPHAIMPEPVTTVADLVASLIRSGTRIALVRGYDWGASHEPALQRLAAAGLLYHTNSLAESIGAVLEGQADGFFGDQLASMAILAEWREQGFRMHPLVLQERPVHMLFARGKLPDWQLHALNQALEQLLAEGQVARIIQRYTDPISIRMLLDSRAFESMFLLGIVAFSISGVVIARQGDYSIYGAFVLASLPALGGGMVRDVLLLRPIFFLDAPEMLYACIGTISAGYLLNRGLDRLRGRSLWFFDLVNLLVRLRRRLSPRMILEVFDAIGLALFTVIAVSIAAEEGLEPLWVWGPIIGAVSATGGAILRDMIRQESRNPMLHNSFYGETAIIWSIVLALFLQYAGPYASQQQVMLGLLSCMLGIFLTRMAFVVFRWRSPKY
jgi:polar amino acid transport system substrate-binding protein